MPAPAFRPSWTALLVSFLAIWVGCFAAYGTGAFRWVFTHLLPFVHGAAADDLGAVPWWRLLLVLGVGGLIIGLFQERLKLKRVAGPADTIRSVIQEESRIPWKETVFAALGTVLAIGVGAPVGRYGPAVHLGAGLGSLVGGWAKFPPGTIRILVGAGVAAAISAAFNTPIAGVVFAHEVIIGHFRLRAFAPVTLASVTAQAIARWHGFEVVTFGPPADSTPLTLPEYPLFALIGLLAGGLSLLFMATVFGVGKLALRLRVSPRWQPAAAGVLIAVVGIILPQVLGLGESTIAELASGEGAANLGTSLLLALIVGKLVASALALGLRIPGGIFAPALFLGAALGVVLGRVLNLQHPEVAALVGMGAAVSCVVGAPLATILIVFELTRNYEATTAVMTGVIVANALVTRLLAPSFFHQQLRSWGVDIRETPENRILLRRKVEEIAGADFDTIEEGASLKEAADVVESSRGREVFVVSEGGHLRGILDGYHLVGKKLTGSRGQTKAGDIASTPTHYLAAQESIREGLRDIETFVGHTLPVVEDEESMILVGAVTEAAFIRAYNEAVEEARLG